MENLDSKVKEFVFAKAHFYSECAADLFFEEDERFQFENKFEGLFELIQEFGWTEEFLGVTVQ